MSTKVIQREVNRTLAQALEVCSQRLAKAHQIVKAGGVTARGNGLYEVKSQSDGKYTVSLKQQRCHCWDWKKHGDRHSCKHILAAELYEESRLAEGIWLFFGFDNSVVEPGQERRWLNYRDWLALQQKVAAEATESGWMQGGISYRIGSAPSPDEILANNRILLHGEHYEVEL